MLARGDRLELDDLLVDADELGSGTAGTLGSEASGARPGGSLHDFLDRAAADRIRAALRDAGDVKVDAARALGIDRTTLYRLMRKYGIAES